MTKAIFFDFGNVLSFFDYGQALARLRPYTELTVEELRTQVLTAELLTAYETGRLSTAAFLAEARRRGRLRCLDALLAAAWSEIFRRNDEVCALATGLSRHYRLFLASNTNELHAQQFRRQFAEVLRHFEALFLSYEIGVCKPEAGFFQHCQEQAGCRPEQCLFIDDLPANAAGAQACGWDAIVYRSPRDLKEQLLRRGISIE